MSKFEEHAKFEEYAKIIIRWKTSPSPWALPYSIKLLVRTHYPRNLRQYAADNILLRAIELEYGVTK